MKRITILMPNLKMGGAQKALLALLQEFDYNLASISLILFDNTGELVSQIPSEVNVSYFDNYYQKLANKYHKSTKKDLLTAISRFDIKYIGKKIKKIKKYKTLSTLHEEQRVWAIIKDEIENIEIDCDICVSYMQGTTTYYMIDKVKTPGTKITMFNTDYLKAGYCKEFDEYYFSRVEKIACVSEEGKQILKSVFPEYTDKILFVGDVTSYKRIISNAKQPTDIIFSDKQTNIVTCGRIEINIKGYDFIVEVAKKLKKEGYRFCWYIIGDGGDKHKLENLIKQERIEDCVKLLGLIVNPYPVMRQADFMVIASRFEGKSLVIKESQALKIPLISTASNSVYSEITDGINGYIVDISSEDIYERVKFFLDNPKEIENIANNIRVPEQTGIEQYYTLFNI